MSEIHVEEHASLIRAPKQLIIVMMLAFAVPVGLVAILASFVAGGGDYSKNNPQMSDEAIARRIQPVGTVVISEGGAPGAEKSGKEVYEAVCATCHSTGVLNAPKLGDKAACAKLIAEGQETLTADAMKGVRQMPPRGGNPNLSDAEFARAVVYMANAAGVAGAPKTGDKAAWAPRLATGMDHRYTSSLKGKGAMPPKGGNVTLPDADVKAAVDYMVSLVK